VRLIVFISLCPTIFNIPHIFLINREFVFSELTLHVDAHVAEAEITWSFSITGLSNNLQSHLLSLLVVVWTLQNCHNSISYGIHTINIEFTTTYISTVIHLLSPKIARRISDGLVVF